MKLPKGFQGAGVAAGLKPSGDLDVALLASDRPAVSFGVLTTNRYQAAPIAVTKRHLRTGSARAIAVNAGNANACTGPQGIADAREMAKVAGRAIGCQEKEVLVASTGVIGRFLDMTSLRAGLTAAAKTMSPDLNAVAAAIMTTDTRPKVAEATVGNARIVGVAKGAGMMAPEMATMLCFLLTDATVNRALLSQTLQTATAGSFNMISVDGCMSTNDCVLALANGAAGGEPMTPDHDDAAAFSAAASDVCGALARAIVEDGEGMSKVVAITVRGATSPKEAKIAARRIADSVLLRCAIGGADPNWGRVLAALGTAPITFDPNVVDVWLGGEKVAERGAPGPGDLDKAKLAMREQEVEIVVEMNRGDAEATVYTNDMTADYVRINGDYTS